MSDSQQPQPKTTLHANLFKVRLVPKPPAVATQPVQAEPEAVEFDPSPVDGGEFDQPEAAAELVQARADDLLKNLRAAASVAVEQPAALVAPKKVRAVQPVIPEATKVEPVAPSIAEKIVFEEKVEHVAVPVPVAPVAAAPALVQAHKFLTPKDAPAAAPVHAVVPVAEEEEVPAAAGNAETMASSSGTWWSSMFGSGFSSSNSQKVPESPASNAPGFTLADQTWIDPSGGKRAPIPTVGTPASKISPRDPNHRFRVDDHKRRASDRTWKPDLPDVLLPEQPPILPAEQLPALVGHAPSKYTGFASQVPKADFIKQQQLKAQVEAPELLKLNKYPLEPPMEELPEFPEPQTLGKTASRQDLWEENNPRLLGEEDLPDLDFYPKVHVHPDQLPAFLERHRKLAAKEKEVNPFGPFVLGDLKGILGFQGSDFQVQRQWMKLNDDARSELIQTNWKLTQMKYCGRALGRLELCRSVAHRPFWDCSAFARNYLDCAKYTDEYFTRNCQQDHIAFMDAVYNIDDFKTVSVAFRELQKCFVLPRLRHTDFWNL